MGDGILANFAKRSLRIARRLGIYGKYLAK
jgi:hypothetical protein